METFWLTILAAVILMVLVCAGLAIGRILTGKSRLKRGCGLNPMADKEKTKSTCPLCNEKKICEKENGDDPDNRNDST